uniref:Nudix hydrolase domain-containing protein n=1 Tax=Steinernema glaseri TaxID=37863 RepID=A0A1I8AP62_9BILA
FQVWQSAHRPTRTDAAEVQGVDVVAILNRGGKRYFILVKQYRIPMGAWCIEFPAGLIDHNESVDTAALRELKEETGYVGRIVDRSSGIQPLNPGLSDDACQFVTVEVDGDAPENSVPKQQLDSAEAIE